VSCEFDLAHYRELLRAAKAGGYRFAFFERGPEPGTLLLRHDVDLSLDAALAVAELEAEAGATATYFLMTRSEFYNLNAPSGEDAIERLRGLGHRVGLHAVWPDVDRDERFDSVLAWHNPDPEYMREPVGGFVNVMEAPWADVYRSDSNQHWRQGCPHEELAAGTFERLQLLTHPEIWAYPGSSMRETMLSMLDAERERRLTQLAADRIDLA
jgi:hypothetical protein